MEETDAPVDVFVGTSWQAGQVQELLENAGITALLRDEVMGRIDAPALAPGSMGCVKVMVSSEDVERAETVIKDFGGQKGLLDDESLEDPTGEGIASDSVAMPATSTWACSSCGEQVEEQFGACWNCGTARP